MVLDLDSENLLLNTHSRFDLVAVIAVHFKVSGDTSSAFVFGLSFVFQGFSHYVLRLRTTWTLCFIKLCITLSGLLTLPNISETTKDLSFLLFRFIFLLLIGFSYQMTIYDQISCSSGNFILSFQHLCCIFISTHLLFSFIVCFWLSSAFKVGWCSSNYTFASISSINVFAPQYQVVRWTLWLISGRHRTSFIFTLPWLFGLVSLRPYLLIGLFFLLLLFFIFF